MPFFPVLKFLLDVRVYWKSIIYQTRTWFSVVFVTTIKRVKNLKSHWSVLNPHHPRFAMFPNIFQDNTQLNTIIIVKRWMLSYSILLWQTPMIINLNTKCDFTVFLSLLIGDMFSPAMMAISELKLPTLKHSRAVSIQNSMVFTRCFFFECWNPKGKKKKSNHHMVIIVLPSAMDRQLILNAL